MLSRSTLLPLTTRTLFRTTVPRTAAFHTSLVHQKTATESAKDTLKKVDRTVSDELVKGLEGAESVKEKTKEVLGSKAEQAKANAKYTAAEAGAKKEELKGEAKGKAYEVEGKAKGKAEEVRGKL